MSLISDALKKAELQRPAPAPVRAAGWDRSLPDQTEPQRAPARRSSRRLFLANLAVLVVLSVAALYFFRNGPVSAVGGSPQVVAADADESEVNSAVEMSAASTAAPVEDRSSVERISASPFQPVSAVAATPPVSDDYALDGISALGSNTLLSVVRRSDRRSVWIPVGKTVGEVTAVSFDPETDQAVIRVRGALVSISMREAAPSPDVESAPAE